MSKSQLLEQNIFLGSTVILLLIGFLLIYYGLSTNSHPSMWLIGLSLIIGAIPIALFITKVINNERKKNDM